MFPLSCGFRFVYGCSGFVESLERSYEGCCKGLMGFCQIVGLQGSGPYKQVQGFQQPFQ